MVRLLPGCASSIRTDDCRRRRRHGESQSRARRTAIGQGPLAQCGHGVRGGLMPETARRWGLVLTTVNAPYREQLDAATLAACLSDLELAKRHSGHISTAHSWVTCRWRCRWSSRSRAGSRRIASRPSPPAFRSGPAHPTHSPNDGKMAAASLLATRARLISSPITSWRPPCPHPNSPSAAPRRAISRFG